MDQTVIIPREENDPTRKQYFRPRFVEIIRGDAITWINNDNKVHKLTSGDPDTHIQDRIFESGGISSGEVFTRRFYDQRTSIRYFCSLHPSERGIILLLSKHRDLYHNPEWLQLLAEVFIFGKGYSEYKKIHTDLRKYVDPIVLEQINDPNLVTLTKKELTVVFWDISGFSVLCDIMKDHTELVVEFLKEYFSVINAIVHRNGGILDKFIGDGVMAYFGFKEQEKGSSNNAVDAVNAALEARIHFQEIKDEWIKIWKMKVNLDIRCGMNTGPALVGLILTEDRDQFTTIGSTVNLASRLEGRAEGNQIIVSPYTRTRIEHIFDVNRIQIKKEDRIKGFEELTEYYEVLSLAYNSSVDR